LINITYNCKFNWTTCVRKTSFRLQSCGAT